jgi:hypothetical protein
MAERRFSEAGAVARPIPILEWWKQGLDSEAGNAPGDTRVFWQRVRKRLILSSELSLLLQRAKQEGGSD